MRLQHITFTGIDGKTDLGRLWEIQQEYPIAEFGVLVAKNWRDNGNRYFNPSYLNSIERYSGGGGLNLSAHLCGSIARAAIKGDWQPFRDWARCYPFFFKRCQINIAKSAENPESFVWEGDAQLFDEIILQQKSAKDCPLFMNSKISDHITVLLDGSGGKGINTPLEPLNLPHKIGYAGGFNADNVADKLSFLLTSEQVGDFWIDMESGVRTDDWFDLDNVVKVLEICDKVIKSYPV